MTECLHLDFSLVTSFPSPFQFLPARVQDLVTTYSDLKIKSIRLEMAKQPGGNPEAWVSNALE